MLRLLVVSLFSLSATMLPSVSVLAEDASQATVQEQNSVDGVTKHLIQIANDFDAVGNLEGEVLIVREGEAVFHLMDKVTLADYVGQFREPQYVLGSAKDHFVAAAMLKFLYDSSPAVTEELRVEEVRGRLASPISYFLPDTSPLWNGKIPAWANQVTLRQLLTHSSGIPDYQDEDAFLKEQARLIAGSGRERGYKDFLASIFDEPLEFTPGEEHEESPSNYLLVREIFETVAGQPLSAYLQEQFFTRLALSSTFPVVEGKWDILKNDPSFEQLAPIFLSDMDYAPVKLTKLSFGEDLSILYGIGSIVSTASDLAIWSKALHKDKVILSEKLYDVFLDLYKGNAEGMSLREGKIGQLLIHGGKDDSTTLIYAPECDLFVFYQFNNVGFKARASSGEGNIYSFHIPSDFVDAFQWGFLGFSFYFSDRGCVNIPRGYIRAMVKN